MSGKFKKVTRFQCVHCDKEFKTQRHDCKFDPSKKNCLTCRHCRGQENAVGHIDEGDYEPPSFICAAGQDAGVTDLDVIQSVKWNMQCEKWERLESQKEKSERSAYRDHMIRILDENLKKQNEEIKREIGINLF